MRAQVVSWIVRSEGRALVLRLIPASAVGALACLDRGDVVGQVLPLVPDMDELSHRVAVLRPVLRHLRMSEADVRALAQPPLLRPLAPARGANVAALPRPAANNAMQMLSVADLELLAEEFRQEVEEIPPLVASRLFNDLRREMREQEERQEREALPAPRAPQPSAPASAPVPPPRLTADEVARDQYLAMLVDMGFPAETALKTLIECANNLELAVDRLMGEPARARDPPVAAAAPDSPTLWHVRSGPKTAPAPASTRRTFVTVPKCAPAPGSPPYARSRAWPKSSGGQAPRAPPPPSVLTPARPNAAGSAPKPVSLNDDLLARILGPVLGAAIDPLEKIRGGDVRNPAARPETPRRAVAPVTPPAAVARAAPPPPPSRKKSKVDVDGAFVGQPARPMPPTPVTPPREGAPVAPAPPPPRKSTRQTKRAREALKNGAMVENIIRHEENLEFGFMRFLVRYAGAAEDAWIDEDELQAIAPDMLARYWLSQE
jgi:hypothetical protein